MVKTGMTFEGDISVGFKRLEKALGERTLRAAGFAGAEVFRDAVKQRVPVDTGTIQRNVIVKRLEEQSNANEVQSYLVTVRTGKENAEGDAYYWKWVDQGHKFVPKRKVKSRKGKKLSEVSKTTRKKHRELAELEYGTAKRGARPFMRPAYEAVKGQAAEAIRQRMRQRIAEFLGRK